MARTIWQRVGGPQRFTDYTGAPWRVVEAQHRISTRKLVDSDEEQALLEDLLDTAKPPLPAGPAFERLHYLLSTPFRHPPLDFGSRFGSRSEPSLYYASEQLDTAFAEVAYYRLLFLSHTAADLGPVMVELTTFTAAVCTDRAVDLTQPPFHRFRRSLVSRSDYRVTQALGRDMRADGALLVRYESARDPAGGANVGIFDPAVFASPRPRGLQTWLCVATPDGVELSQRTYFSRAVHRFARSDFTVRGALPAPAA